MAKYAMLRERIERDPVLARTCRLAEPGRVALLDIDRVHDVDYRLRVLEGALEPRAQRRIGLPWSPELVERTLRSVGGTLAACRAALDDGRAAYLGGGTHHAFPGFGAGFCVFNDAPIALRTLQAEKRIHRAVILDCDVHQGDGTAAILAHDPSVFTMSIHGARNFPFRKQISDLDVALADGTGDDEYLTRLEAAVNEALEASRAQFALYIAGADPYEKDRLGKLSLTMKGLADRDRLVLGRCARAGLPVAVVMGGGYAPDLDETAAIQAETVRLAATL